jgi:hypothetical protein
VTTVPDHSSATFTKKGYEFRVKNDSIYHINMRKFGQVNFTKFCFLMARESLKFCIVSFRSTNNKRLLTSYTKFLKCIVA